MRPKLWGVGAAVALALSLAAPSLAAAAPIVVDTTSDTSSAGAPCSLPEAIDNANSDDPSPTNGCAAGSGADTISFNLSSLPTTIDLATALPIIHFPLSIVGPGAAQLDIQRSSGSNFRILTFTPDDVGPDIDRVSGLTLSDGNLVDGVGAGISMGNTNMTLDHVVVTGNHAGANSPGGSLGQGGGIFINNNATLHLISSTVSDNHLAVVAPSGTGGSAVGGGIDNEGTMTVTDSTISGNDATETASGSNLAVADGGGIFNGKSATIRRSTIFGNAVSSTSVTGPSGSNGGGLFYSGSSLGLSLSTVGGNVTTSTTSGTTEELGAGVYISTAGATLTGDTIAFNTGGSSGNLASTVPQPGSPVARDTIVSNSSGPNCSFAAGGSLTSAGYNVEDDAPGSCLFEATHDLALGTDPLLGPMLVNNGGPTRTYTLQAGSPAIESGSAFGEKTDQRGLLRPSDDLAVATKAGSDGSDIGAFEVQGQPFPGPPPPTTTPPPTPTAPVHKKHRCKKKHKKKSAAAAKKKCKKKKRK